MREPDHPIAAVCPVCGARVPLADFRSEGFLRARREVDGGPFYELACARCAAGLRLRWEPDGCRVVELRPRAGLLGHSHRPAREQAQRFPPETPEERSGPRAAPEEGPEEAEPDPQPESEPDAQFATELEPGESVERMREILGVDDSAGRASVLAAFRERSKRLHPDRFSEFDGDFQALAHRKFIELKRARDCLLAIIGRRDRPT